MINHTPPHLLLLRSERLLQMAMKTASVCCLMGLPASGKSTFANSLLDILKEKHTTTKNDTFTSQFDKIIVIDYDYITQELYLNNNETNTGSNISDEDGIHNSLFDNNDLESWRKTRVTALANLKDVLTIHFTQDTADSSIMIIMDDNFHLRSMRRDVYRICQEILAIHTQAIIGFSTIYFQTPLEVCIERNNTRNGKACIPIDVIRRMDATIEQPDTSKPYASFERFSIPIGNNNNISDDIHTDDIYTCIEQSLQSPILPKNELSSEEVAKIEEQRILHQEATRKCHIQQFDQLLRKLVGAVGRIEKKKSREANEIRKSIMDRIRKQNDDKMADNRDHIVEHFTSSLIGIEKSNLDSPLVKSINDTYQQFQKDQIVSECAGH